MSSRPGINPMLRMWAGRRVLPEKDDHNLPGVRDIADRLTAGLGLTLLHRHLRAQNGRRIEVETDNSSIGARAEIKQRARHSQFMSKFVGNAGFH